MWLIYKGVCRPAVVVSYLLASFAAILSAFCYTEFAVDLPVAGGSLVFVNITFGELPAWCAIPVPLHALRPAWHIATLWSHP